MSKVFIVDCFYFLYFLEVKTVLVSSANRKKKNSGGVFYVIDNENSIGIVRIVLDLIYFFVALHMLWNFVPKVRYPFLQLACGLLDKIQTNFWQFPLYHNFSVSIAIFCGQQYQMFFQGPKIHYQHSSLYQVHLLFSSVGQLLLDLSLIVLINNKSNKSFCFVGRPTDEEDTRNLRSSKFGREVVQEKQLERKSPGNNPRELVIPGSNSCL